MGGPLLSSARSTSYILTSCIHGPLTWLVKVYTYLDQSSVLSVFDIFPNALFPVTPQSAWRFLRVFIARVAFGSWWARWARGPLASLFAIVALVSSRPLWSLRAGRSRNTSWSRGTRAPRDTWDSWRAKASTGTITRRSTWEGCFTALHEESKSPCILSNCSNYPSYPPLIVFGRLPCYSHLVIVHLNVTGVFNRAPTKWAQFTYICLNNWGKEEMKGSYGS